MYTVYSKDNCKFCKMAKDLLDLAGEDFEDFDITTGTNRDDVNARLGYEIKTVPQIWHEDKYIGGYEDLKKYIDN